MDSAALLDTLGRVVPGASFEVARSIDVTTVYVPAGGLVETCQALRDAPELRFDFLAEVTAVDYLPRDPRYEVVYQLVSTSNRLRLRLKVRVPDGGAVPTVSGVWPAAGWPEREVWDMFGISIDGHPDLRRLLMPEDWEGHPQRKDYPVQIRQPPKIYEPLQIDEEQFRRSLARDRMARLGH